MNKKLLTPLKISSIRADELSEKKSPGNNSQRIKRENLKQYLSSNDIKLSHHSNKKPFELTESHLFLPTSPRVLQKLATSTDNKQCTKEKCIDKMIALKLANKNVLKVFSMNRLSREEILKEKLFITIPDELKKLDQGGVSERTEASKLLEWFEVMEKTQLERCLNREKLNKLDFEQQKQELDVAESILSLGLVKLIDQVQTHCNEQAIAIRKIFAFYKKFWKIVLRTKLNSSEQHGIVLCSQMDNLKSEQIALVKLHKAETQKVKPK